jgi:hypothetical protein
MIVTKGDVKHQQTNKHPWNGSYFVCSKTIAQAEYYVYISIKIQQKNNAIGFPELIAVHL